ncbi:putative LRR receptor-like serine/threonine-protein kinase [Dorcoceras hygrometricum]|uniref:Putative LRR receptor-like serine/threonine-protein kinase n=1 Tax=Dorcoceras hygrometricum TaxID=472368 RepID=A0A2Z7BKC2_9LAMI|nr:putative LRR receptor-like serine/threonine-protein kinase [Dorcoceras hygrometricum]
MASSYISNALQINFDSVLGIHDNDGMVNMFRALEATGLRGFLGCPSVLYEQELEQIFDTALVLGILLFILLSEMASSYISNALQINFDSVLGIHDNDGMVNMFRALEATGLRGFLGCPSVLYEQELEQIFDTALIQDLPQEPLRSGEDDDMYGFKQPSKIIESAEEEETDIEPVDTEDLSLAKDVATMMESEDIGSVSKALELTDSPTSDEESMSLEDILKQIPVDVMMPSVIAAEITRIKFARSIEIREVHEGDWYKASIPQISTADKGKAPLVEDTIKGHPAREMFSLICADIDFLVQLREKLLAWAETDSLETAVRRREFTIAKYREMLLRKFLESHRQHFQAGLQTQMRIHGLKWERICSSILFEGENRDRGAVIARSNTSTRSLCWLRTKTMIEGSWVIEEANDLWQRLPPKKTVPLTIELSPKRQLMILLPPDIVAVSTAVDITVDASDFVGVFRRGTDVHMILSESISSSSGSAHPDPAIESVTNVLFKAVRKILSVVNSIYVCVVLIGVARSSPGARLDDWVFTCLYSSKPSSGTFPNKEEGEIPNKEEGET